MFRGLRKRKFSKKCKVATRLTKTRLETIKKKRNAMHKFLKNDIADLLKNDLHKNAYGRAEGFLVELNLTTCYEFVEKFCVQILNNASIMHKQSECPEDCREAVSSLIFAAARFADLPDLRDLRSLFTEKYGTSLDSYVKKEFVDKLQLTHPTKDMKLQLMQHIAEESGVQWDRNTAEEKLFNEATESITDDEFRAHGNADGSPRRKYTEHSLSQKHRYQHIEERTPFRNIPQQGKKEFAEENVKDNEILEHKPIPPPPYRRSYVDQTRNSDEGQEVPVRKSKPKAVSVRRRRSKLVFSDNEDDSVSSARKDAESGHKEPDFNHNQPDGEEHMINKRHHIRSTSCQTENKKLLNYDNVVARLAAFRDDD